MFSRKSLFGLVIVGLSISAFAQAEGTVRRPKLVLQITVDQLRGDMPYRYYDRLGDGGFRYLLDEGTVYTDAHHGHANTETIVGHATLATGAHPSAHGMIGNVWLDRKQGVTVYNIEDPRYRLLTAGADVDKKVEIDPTQRVARSEGRSPAAILVSTVSDELALHTAGGSKVFGVSVKDRGAVSMAGHAGKAFWFSKQSGEFVTSTFYYDQYPAWVDEWNARKLAATYGGKSWELLNEKSTYLFGSADDVAWETDLAGFGRAFPHPYGPADGKYFTTLLTVSPAGDELTLDFAKALIEHEELGKDDVPDYLSVSFSSTDYVGHLFGPSSLESEDQILRLDKMLADLIHYVDERVGLRNTLIVLSADHGAPEAPGFLNQFGFEASYVTPKTWDKQPAIDRLKRRFGIGEELIEGYEHPYIYLNQAAILEKKLDAWEVERAVAAELVKFPGVAHAVSSNDLREGRVPDTELNTKVLNNYSPSRSGDIYVIFQPHSFVNDFDGLTVASTHGQPWSYDTYVPIIFTGGDVPARQVHRRVATVDVAATICACLGVKPPSGSAGRVLTEVLSPPSSN
jgi:predicted AlkP superfamily pyrophosphatase or phosphodiesterase